MTSDHSASPRNHVAARKTTHPAYPSNPTGPAARVIDPKLLVIVFVGGTVGSTGRYALSVLPATGPESAFHMGTLTANLIACFFYSGIASLVASAHWINAAHKPYWNRGWCMGVCGGLSTMSALMLETFKSLLDGHTAWGLLYLLTTFVSVLLVAAIGARCGVWIATSLGRRITAEGLQQ